MLPISFPAILTGSVLAVARAFGESAPLLLAGAVLSNFFSAPAGTSFLSQMTEQSYTALPIVIYNWARQPQEEFVALTAAGIVVLLVTLLLVNTAAIIARDRFERRSVRYERPGSFSSSAGDETEVDVRETPPPVFQLEGLSVYYGDFLAVADVTLSVLANEITAFIGPSGCGKSTILRCFNRMNDLIEIARVEGKLSYHGVDLYGPQVDPVEVRRRIGMVFQKPNPFPKSIYENIAFGPRIAGQRSNLDDLVEETLQRAALWDEVKDKLGDPALALSGGQQQRLCIARAIATQPEVVLMDEPCSALDPIATFKIEELMQELKKRVHDSHRHPQHAASRKGERSHRFLLGRRQRSGSAHGAPGRVRHHQQASSPTPSRPETEAYITGRFG